MAIWRLAPRIQSTASRQTNASLPRISTRSGQVAMFGRRVAASTPQTTSLYFQSVISFDSRFSNSTIEQLARMNISADQSGFCCPKRIERKVWMQSDGLFKYLFDSSDKGEEIKNHEWARLNTNRTGSFFLFVSIGIYSWLTPRLTRT